MGNQVSNTNRKRVVVVGGGYGGTVAAKELDSTYDVTLIDTQDALHHRFATLRAAVVPGWENRIRIPLDKLLKNGRVVCGKVTAVDSSSVTLEDGTSIEADYIILAHGRQWSFPAAPLSEKDSSSEVASVMKQKQQLVKEASSILIIGGGPVGVELAGEIAAQHTGKKITLVHSGDTLLSNAMPPLHPRVAELALQKLTNVGVSVMLNKRVSDLPQPRPNDSFIAKAATYQLSDGTSVSVDLAIITTGSAPHSAAFGPVDEKNLVKVDAMLRVEGWNNVYCVGDANNVLETKMGYAAEQQAVRASHNIIRRDAGKEEKPYVPAGGQTKYGVMMVPIGPNSGVAGIGETIMDDFMTATIKSKGLFVKKSFGLRNAIVPQLQ